MNLKLIVVFEDDGCQWSEYVVLIDVGFDFDVVVSECKVVVGVGFMVYMMGNCCVGLYCGDVVFRGWIVCVGVVDIFVVKMVCEEDVYVCCDQNGDGESGMFDEFDVDFIGWWDEGVVGDDQFQVGVGIVKMGLQYLKLVGGNVIVFLGEGVGGVEVCDD